MQKTRGSSPRLSRSDSASAKGRKARQGRAVTVKRRAQRVWHISRFQERYELPDDVRYNRKSPLQFTKDFVGSGTDDESCSFHRQLLSLRNRPDWLMLRGAFAEIKSVGANMSQRFRGYLLNSDFDPASDEQIACWLGLQNGQAKHVLKTLASVRLIEQVAMPDFAEIRPKKGHKKRGKTESKKGDKKQSRPKKDVFRARTETPGNPLRAKVKVKVNGKIKINGNGKIQKKNNNGDGNAQVKANVIETERQDQPQVEPPTAELPPKPKEADPGGSSAKKSFGPRGPDKRSGPLKLGEILSGIQHRYDPDAKSFAGDIFRALGLTCAPNSKQGCRELGAFGSLWMRAQHAGLSPPALAELREKSLADARKLSRQRTRYRKISAVWTDIFNKRIGQ